ncbi:MAG: chorismate mutase, partial [Saprospiraceae bacterium]|nr:chorismate mutase [Saprospiraceae bacterium]
DGVMTEVHPRPDEAWSDAEQQLTPDQFAELLGQLVLRQPTTDDEAFLENLEHLRHQIDDIDDELMNLLCMRMQLAERIGAYKKRNNISILQPERWGEILEKAIVKGKVKGLSEEFVAVMLKAIHEESINHQARVMNEEVIGE